MQGVENERGLTSWVNHKHIIEIKISTLKYLHGFYISTKIIGAGMNITVNYMEIA